MPRSKDDYPTPHPRYPIARVAAQFSQAVDMELSKLAPSRATVLITGGSAALRQAAAVALHERSPRSALPFVVFDCKAHPPSDLGGMLFGGPPHVSAVAGGAAQRAGAGTLHVAQIEGLPLLEQPRFLRFLDQERAARVVVSSGHELSSQVSQGKIRLDLAERLAAIELVVVEADS